LPTHELLVLAIVVYEVHEKLLLTNNDVALRRFISHAFRADAMIYAIAQTYSAQLVTADPDFRGLSRVIIP
jgi:predicted nucleic acid-binding protein